jgi:hypothetical protein
LIRAPRGASAGEIAHLNVKPGRFEIPRELLSGDGLSLAFGEDRKIARREREREETVDHVPLQIESAAEAAETHARAAFGVARDGFESVRFAQRVRHSPHYRVGFVFQLPGLFRHRHHLGDMAVMRLQLVAVDLGRPAQLFPLVEDELRRLHRDGAVKQAAAADGVALIKDRAQPRSQFDVTHAVRHVERAEVRIIGGEERAAFDQRDL